MHPACEIEKMIQAKRDEQARHWVDIPDDDFKLRVAIDYERGEIQKRIRERYPAEFDSEQGSN